MSQDYREVFCWKIKKMPSYEDYTTHPKVPKMKIPYTIIPYEMSLALKKKHLVEQVPEKCKNYAKCIESLSNVQSIRHEDYLIVFKICLYLEQYQSNVEMGKLRLKNYGITEVISDQCFIIKVESLDNDKPLLVPNDTVILYEVVTKERYVGIVANVVGDKVTVQVETPVAMKMVRDKRRFNIQFESQHWPLRCCHYALSLASKFNFLEIMYPQKTIYSADLKCDIDWINASISKNEQQKQAIIKILHMTARPAPYIIFGPPGTGKTATLVEAICQIVKQDDKNHILVCTTSNAAADGIVRKLIKYLPEEIIYRMYAPCKKWEDIDTDIQKCANFKSGTTNNTIVFLPREILILKKIIISTLITSARLSAVRFRENYFSHIIIDEASQATEPEILIPFTLTKNEDVNDITNFKTQIVIAGDPYQLGPVVRSRYAQNILGKSMLERLMTDCDLYKKRDGKYDPNYVTKLIKNYRSHEHILHVSNKYFYENELICCGQADTQIALNWQMLPNKKFPIIFQEVLGVEETTRTKSVYNMAEALVVVAYVEMLINTKFGNYIISEKDIGIVTPFKRQQINIMHKLAVRGWENISVGTVETFQGQERTVIILSTARSKTFWRNGANHIGFLSNPKRFNVAVTRAKALLIVVCNPEIICTNKYWNALCDYCINHDSYKCFEQCPLHPEMIETLKKHYETNSRSSQVNIDVSSKVSVTVKTDLMEKVKQLKTLRNVLVCGNRRTLTLTE